MGGGGGGWCESKERWTERRGGRPEQPNEDLARVGMDDVGAEDGGTGKIGDKNPRLENFAVNMHKIGGLSRPPSKPPQERHGNEDWIARLGER